MYEKKMVELIKQQEDDQAIFESAQEQLDEMKKLLHDYQKSIQVSNIYADLALVSVIFVSNC